MFIEAEKEKLTNNLTLNLRCHRNVWSVRQWSFGRPRARPSLPQFIESSQSLYYAHNGRGHEANGDLPLCRWQIVKGTIIEVRPKEVLVDIGYKSEGVISGNEFEDIKTVKVGDEIDVLIEKLEDKEGMVVLSKEKAEFKKNWERILTICNEGGTIAGKVKAIVKGGLLVNIGVEAFLPASQIDIITAEEPQPSTSATPTISRSSRSTRSGRTSSSPAAN